MPARPNAPALGEYLMTSPSADVDRLGRALAALLASWYWKRCAEQERAASMDQIEAASVGTGELEKGAPVRPTP